MSRSRIISVVLVALSILLAAPAVWGILGVDDGLIETSNEVDGVPVMLITPDGEASGLPGVVVVHGFAASSTIMEPLGRMLARAGYAVALPDVSGHGANSSSLSVDDTSRDELQVDVAAVLSWLGAQPAVDADRLALVGHSMGAGAVTRYSIDNPDAVQATVAISLPSSIEPVGIPRALLLLYGSAEPAGFATAAQEQFDALKAADPAADVVMEIIPGVEHISVVWSPSTAEATLGWIGSAVDGPTAPVDLDPAWLWLILLLLAGCLFAVPLARWLFGPVRSEPEARVAGWVGIVLTFAAAVVASLVASFLGGAAESLIPVAVGGYLAVWFAVAAAVIGIGMLVVRRYRRRSFGPPNPRAIAATLGMTAFAVLLLILSARVTWATAAFVGPRWWVWIVLSLVLLGYFYADAVLVARASLGGRIGVLVANRLIITIVLFVSVLWLGAPSILTLLLPIMVLLFLLLGYLALIITWRVPGRFGPALVQAVPLAAIVASGFPLIG